MNFTPNSTGVPLIWVRDLVVGDVMVDRSVRVE
jgi:hypothetical protein